MGFSFCFRIKNKGYDRERRKEKKPNNRVIFSFYFVMKENEYQKGLKKKLRKEFPGCYIFKNDPNDQQGIPDLLVTYQDKWCALECKQSATASHRPNQDYYVNDMNSKGMASFIYPENEQEIILKMHQYFGG